MFIIALCIFLLLHTLFTFVLCMFTLKNTSEGGWVVRWFISTNIKTTYRKIWYKMQESKDLFYVWVSY